MDEHSAAVGWLFGTEPTDRALAGWRPRVWLDLGTAVPAKEWQPVLRYAPCRYGLDWRESVTSRQPGPDGEPL